MATERWVHGFDPADRVADPGCNGLAEPLDRVGAGEPSPAPETDRGGQLFDEEVPLDPGPLGASRIMRGLGLVDVGFELLQAGSVFGNSPPVEGFVSAGGAGRLRQR